MLEGMSLRAQRGPARLRGALAALLVLVGCSSEKLERDGGTAGRGSKPDPNEQAGLLELSVGPAARSFVELSTPAELSLENEGRDSIAWDLALQGRDVFTNGGVSGPGNASAFGPLSAPTFLSDTAPEVPIMLEDRAGGALLGWYDYGGDTHQLFSRYHVYGLRDGERYFKLQILGYYGERLGAPVAALYHVRYAEVLETGVGETQELLDIDATAGGDSADDRQTSACLDLDNHEVTQLTPQQAAASEAWQLCFRRENIAVNGGKSGPLAFEAVDLQAELTATEQEADIQKRSAKSELPLFDEVDYATLSDPALEFASDGVATAFARRWLEPGTDPLELSDTVWLVLAADGASKYLVKFESLSGDPASETAQLGIRAKAVR
jgi:hypothetical protein